MLFKRKRLTGGVKIVGKKFFVLLLIVCMSFFLLVGCGGTYDKEISPGLEEQQQQEEFDPFE
jgi:hypothetical protein